MIEMTKHKLLFSVPEVSPDAKLGIDFQRTLRIPDDDCDYPLPPGLGRFPLRHVDDFARTIPGAWLRHGGVMLPMCQSEAMWLNFDGYYVPDRQVSYPFAIKIAAGKINAVTGEGWQAGLSRNPQNYMVVPDQPWLDGYCVEEGIIRQFVAMPLGAGYSAEEQITGESEFGGLQIEVFPMKRKVFERRFPVVRKETFRKRLRVEESDSMVCCAAASDMGLAPGGRMRQEIYDDDFNFNDWDTAHVSRCFVHLMNSLVWRSATGSEPPPTPATAAAYNQAGLPWFEYYDDSASALPGTEALAKLKSVATMGKEKGDVPLPENESVDPARVVELRRNLKPGQVREGAF